MLARTTKKDIHRTSGKRGRGIQPAEDVAAQMREKFPHYRLVPSSFERKDLPATWRCELHNADFRAPASALLNPTGIGCPGCKEDRARRKRKAQRTDPRLERHLALIAEQFSEEHAEIYSRYCEGDRRVDIAPRLGLQPENVGNRLRRIRALLAQADRELSQGRDD